MKSEWNGKQVRILFQDTNAVLSKIGIVLEYDSVFVTLETSQGVQILPLNRIVRIEVLK